MNVLLVYPEFPDTFWSFKHALRFVRRRSAFPPLGLLTVAAMLDPKWSKRLVDCNVQGLTDADLAWADVVFISAMAVQRKGVLEVLARCQRLGVKTVAGGPLFTSEAEKFPGIDHLVLGEAELTLPPFLADLAQDRAEHVYTAPGFADMHESPVPMWDLVRFKDYATMGVQYCRGCPFDCDFCSVTVLLGHKPRTKSPEQVLRELDAIYSRGFRDAVFVVDDNFIGNKVEVKTKLLPALLEWRKTHPGLAFHTEASINLADDPKLIEQMVSAGFEMVFVGIETTNEASLLECSKKHNVGRNLVEDVRRLHRAGLQVQGGFIVGFDSDGPAAFEKLHAFIQETPIVTAMVGVLQALPGTRLHERLTKMGRLTESVISGDNVDGKTNIIPVIGGTPPVGDYGAFVRALYTPEAYYLRVRRFLAEYRAPKLGVSSLARTLEQLGAFGRSIAWLGILGSERFEFWKLLAWTLVRRPRAFPVAVSLAVSGHHFRRMSEARFA